MVARELRLRSPIEFERVRSTGKSWSNDFIVAVVIANELGQNRYGFAVGKRVGNAVARNRAKRLMRESARNLHPRLKQGHDIVFIARNRVQPTTTQTAINDAIEAVLRKAGIVEPERSPNVQP
jgi:ribonuclease P protein component